MSSSDPITLGWREWIALPDLNLPAFKVKVDTGARTSAIHAHDIKRFTADGQRVTDSGGHTETRHVIATSMELAGISKSIEITLTERRDMLFRMLLGRTTLMPDFVVNPALSYTCGRRSTRLLYSEDS